MRIIGEGDTVTLFCPVCCEELGLLPHGVVVWVYPGALVFEVRFPGGRIVTVTRYEIMEPPEHTESSGH